MPPDLRKLASNAVLAERFLKSMANARRLMILCELDKGEASVSALRRALALGQSSLSQHLAKLRAEKLVKARRESQTIHYSLADEKVSRAIALLYDLFCSESAAKVATGAKTKPQAKKKLTPES